MSPARAPAIGALDVRWPADPLPGSAPKRAVLPSHRWAAFEFAGLVLFQAFHQVEHTLEVLQTSLGFEHLHPLVGGLQVEWMHFGGNAILFGCLLAVFVSYGHEGRARLRKRSGLGWTALVTALAVQGSHVVEHVVRVVQFVGGREPDGFATRWLDPIWFHFGINLVFLIAMAGSFFALRIHRDLAGRPDHA